MFNKYKLFYRTIIILSISGLVLPSFGLSETSGTAGPPYTFGEIKTSMVNAFKSVLKFLRNVLEQILVWIKNIWNSYVYPFLHRIWQKIDSIFGREIKERTPVIKEEFKKETQEIKQEVPSVAKSFWQKLKDFFRFK